jgi:hypothetical protein
MESGCKEEIKGISERHFFPRGRKSIILLEGSQATPARPSDRNNVKVKTFIVKIIRNPQIQDAELMNNKIHGTYSYHRVLNGKNF